MTDSQSTCLGVRHPSGAHDQIYITVRQLWDCWCGTPPLMRGQVWSLKLLLGLTSTVILGSESPGTSDLFYCLRFKTPPTWSTMSQHLYPPGTGEPLHYNISAQTPQKTFLPFRITVFLDFVQSLKQLRLVLSTGPNRAGVSLPSPENGNRSSFRSIVLSSI
jgi:hypothetical protein